MAWVVVVERVNGAAMTPGSDGTWRVRQTIAIGSSKPWNRCLESRPPGEIVGYEPDGPAIVMASDGLGFPFVADI